eukprot:CAMPEP_0203746524 /NCGR_PEP_ID=MMETSP0098-20131031/1941_1 /ASSEMBLY_ACC=CAM_ASM_000208 /TAXON_ID=96639 /ORGANISM=" , Strain NY0313808BC1" /LENGTH=253 /DNA_ID=CAMNT_0050634655 /DNA_START=770 /DNA_END=1531 /DNA_ORIENTATION=-
MKSLIAIKDGKEVSLKTAKWGLIPAYTKGPISSSMFFKKFNARADNLKLVHSRLLGKKHCVAFFSGYYEWKTMHDALTGKDVKQPYYIYPKNDDILCFAGLYDELGDPETGERIRTFTLITVDASQALKGIHSRMPVVLSTKENISLWLNTKSWNDKLFDLLIPDNKTLRFHPVGKGVGSTKFQESSCSKEVKLARPLPSVLSFFPKKRKPLDGCDSKVDGLVKNEKRGSSDGDVSKVDGLVNKKAKVVISID